MIRSLLFLLLLLLLPGSSSAVDVQLGPEASPIGAVIVVVDGLGASYVYPEHNAYALDGSPLQKAVLFNLTGGGARAVDVTVPVPETTKSHSVLITGNSKVDPEAIGPSIFDAVRRKGYLCLAVLERGDSMPVLQKMDAVLYLGDNSLHGAEPTPGFRENVPVGIRTLFQEWRDRFADYTAPAGLPGYAGNDAWGLDAARDIVEHLPGQPFVMLVNVGAVDSAGQNLGATGYLQTVQALDGPLGQLNEACRKNNVLLVITADHGMCFPDTKGKGGHSADKYAGRLESLRVPLVFIGPGVEELNLGGRWSEMDIAPTVLGLLNISMNLTAEGNPLPIREGYNLQVAGAPAGMELWRGEALIANGIIGGDYNFRGLPLGLYTLKSGSRSWQVLLNGDKMMDLAGKAAPSGDMKKMIGIILILAINLAGIAVIIRIWKREE
jgi:2,3-bisphosphoglycerate-independent phosphoglycerate mutase